MIRGAIRSVPVWETTSVADIVAASETAAVSWGWENAFYPLVMPRVRRGLVGVSLEVR